MHKGDDEVASVLALPSLRCGAVPLDGPVDDRCGAHTVAQLAEVLGLARTVEALREAGAVLEMPLPSEVRIPFSLTPFSGHMIPRSLPFTL